MGATAGARLLAKNVELKTKEHDRAIGEVRAAAAPKMGEEAPDGSVNAAEMSRAANPKVRV